MGPLKFMSLAGAAVLLVQGAHAGETSTNLSSKEVDCSAAINDARKAAGFEEFTKGKFTEVKTDLEKLCKFIQGQTLVAEDYNTKDVTPTFFQTDTENCNAAVEYWKSGYSLFSEMPPNYTTKDQKPQVPYDNDKARSFVALYSSKATEVACGFVTCPEVKASSGSTQSNTKELTRPDSEGKANIGADAGAGGGRSIGRGGSGVEGGASGGGRGGRSGAGQAADVTYAAKTGLVCGMKPKALIKDTAPFSETEWKQIVDAFTSSASVAAPTTLALAAAALGFVMH